MSNTIRKSDIENCIAMALKLNPMNLKFVRLSDNTEATWRHSCLRTGIYVMKKASINVYGIVVIFGVCPMCGKVMYYVDEI